MENRVVPRIHQIMEFPGLKLLHLLSVLDAIKFREGYLGRIVILTSNDYLARQLGVQLREHSIVAAPVYKQRKERRKRAASARFNSGRYPVLIVSKTGLDTQTGDIHHFINYDMVLPYPVNNGNMLVVKTRRHG